MSKGRSGMSRKGKNEMKSRGRHDDEEEGEGEGRKEIRNNNKIKTFIPGTGGAAGSK